MSDRVDLHAMGKQARSARRALATARTTTKNGILEAMADALEEPSRQAAILEANARDIAAGRETGLSEALIDRLRLTDARVEGMAVASFTVTCHGSTCRHDSLGRSCVKCADMNKDGQSERKRCAFGEPSEAPTPGEGDVRRSRATSAVAPPTQSVLEAAVADISRRSVVGPTTPT